MAVINSKVNSNVIFFYLEAHEGLEDKKLYFIGLITNSSAFISFMVKKLICGYCGAQALACIFMLAMQAEACAPKNSTVNC